MSETPRIMIQNSVEFHPLIKASPDWSAILQQLLDKRSLNVSQAADLMQGWLTEAIPPVLP